MNIAKFCTSLLLICSTTGLLPIASAQESQSWEGTVTVADETGVKMEVTFKKSFAALTGTLKWSDLTPYAMPLTNIEINEQRVYFELEAGPSLSIFDGERLSRDSVKGSFNGRNSASQTSSKGEFVLELKEISEALANSIEQPVELNIDAGTIHGTLLTPDVWKPPIALLISGAADSDRDGNSTTGAGSVGPQPNTLKLLATGLSNEGIATIRCDKRGVGESKYEGFDEADLRFEHYVDDASNWLNALKADDRFSKLLVVGHQAGALVAKLAALEVSVSGVVSLDGAGVPADEIIIERIENEPAMFGQTAVDLDQLKSTLASLKEGETPTNLPPNLQAAFGESIRDYLRSWFKYDPRQVASKLKMPFLVVQGTTDLLFLRGNGPKLAAANANAQLVEIEQMNHILKETGASIEEQMIVMSNPNAPLHKKLVPVIADFVRNLAD